MEFQHGVRGGLGHGDEEHEQLLKPIFQVVPLPGGRDAIHSRPVVASIRRCRFVALIFFHSFSTVSVFVCILILFVDRVLVQSPGFCHFGALTRKLQRLILEIPAQEHGLLELGLERHVQRLEDHARAHLQALEQLTLQRLHLQHEASCVREIRDGFFPRIQQGLRRRLLLRLAQDLLVALDLLPRDQQLLALNAQFSLELGADAGLSAGGRKSLVHGLLYLLGVVLLQAAVQLALRRHQRLGQRSGVRYHVVLPDALELDAALFLAAAVGGTQGIIRGLIFCRPVARRVEELGLQLENLALSGGDVAIDLLDQHQPVAQLQSCLASLTFRWRQVAGHLRRVFSPPAPWRSRHLHLRLHSWRGAQDAEALRLLLQGALGGDDLVQVSGAKHRDERIFRLQRLLFDVGVTLQLRCRQHAEAAVGQHASVSLRRVLIVFHDGVFVPGGQRQRHGLLARQAVAPLLPRLARPLHGLGHDPLCEGRRAHVIHGAGVEQLDVSLEFQLSPSVHHFEGLLAQLLEALERLLSLPLQHEVPVHREGTWRGWRFLEKPHVVAAAQ
eukprot:scaffold1155_cov217-Pinguiococcus_pyrenoidosus.AAC.1